MNYTKNSSLNQYFQFKTEKGFPNYLFGEIDLSLEVPSASSFYKLKKEKEKTVEYEKVNLLYFYEDFLKYPFEKQIFFKDFLVPSDEVSSDEVILSIPKKTLSNFNQDNKNTFEQKHIRYFLQPWNGEEVRHL